MYGRRWKAPLARAIGVDLSLIQRWRIGNRPISKRYTEAIASLVHDRHDQQISQLQDFYRVMVAQIECAEARRILYGMGLKTSADQLLLDRLEAAAAAVGRTVLPSSWTGDDSRWPLSSAKTGGARQGGPP